LRPNAEASQVTTRSQLEQVQPANVTDIHTRNVSECRENAVVLSVLVVDNEGSFALHVTSVSGFTLSRPDLARGLDALNVIVRMNRLQQGDSLLGLGDSVDLSVSNDQRNLGNVFNAMTPGHDQSRNGASSQSGARGVAALSLADLAVPSAPSLCRGEHSTSTAHVSKRSLTRSVRSSSRNTRDTSYGTTCTPAFCCVSHSSAELNGVRLAVVLVHKRVNVLNDVAPYGGHENGRESDGIGFIGSCLFGRVLHCD